MKERTLQRLLQLADSLNNAGLEQRVQVAKTQHLFFQGIKPAQGLNMLFGKRRQISVRENLNQRNFKRRKWQRAIQSIAALLPLPGDPRVTIEESRDDIGFVAVEFGVFFFAHEIAQHGLGDFRVGVVVESPPQHGGSNGHVQQTQPPAHGAKRLADVVVALQGYGLEAGGDRNFTLDGLLQELLVEALNRGENGKLPFGI